MSVVLEICFKIPSLQEIRVFSWNVLPVTVRSWLPTRAFFFFLTCEVGSDVVFSRVGVQLFGAQLMQLLRFAQPPLAQVPLLIMLDELLTAPWLLLLMPHLQHCHGLDLAHGEQQLQHCPHHDCCCGNLNRSGTQAGWSGQSRRLFSCSLYIPWWTGPCSTYNLLTWPTFPLSTYLPHPS